MSGTATVTVDGVNAAEGEEAFPFRVEVVVVLKDPVDELGAFDESEILSSPLKVERVS